MKAGEVDTRVAALPTDCLVVAEGAPLRRERSGTRAAARAVTYEYGPPQPRRAAAAAVGFIRGAVAALGVAAHERQVLQVQRAASRDREQPGRAIAVEGDPLRAAAHGAIDGNVVRGADDER